jgi:hypothetical protein
MLCGVIGSAADREFRDVVDSISNRVHARPLHIPMFGLVNFVAAVARPAGTKHIDLAVWEDLDWRSGDTRDMAESIRASVGGSWKPFVHSRSAQEVVSIYARPEGSDWRLLVVSVERHEATVVQLQLNPDALQRWITLPREYAFGHRRVKSTTRDLDP